MCGMPPRRDSRHLSGPDPSGGAASGAGRPAREMLHWMLLIGSAAVLAMSLALRVSDGEHVAAPLLSRPVPVVCTFKRLVGVDCPGCGLTRCFISLAHGDVRRALSYNPAGLLFFGLVLFQIPYRSLQIWRLRRGLSELCLGALDTWYLWFLAMALVAQWVVLTVVRAFLW
jgi:hypothetical protein